MALKPDGTEGYDIKLKRTEKAYSEDTESEYAQISNTILAQGEPFVNHADKTLQIGDGTTVLKSLPVLKLVDRDKEAKNAYFDEIRQNGVSTLKDLSGKEVFPKTKFWTTINSDGKPEDAGHTEICLDSAGEWHYVGTDGSVGEVCPGTTVPAAQIIPISGILATDRIEISNCIPVPDRDDITAIKRYDKIFGTIYDVESYDGGIYVFVKKKVQGGGKCYLNVFGG